MVLVRACLATEGATPIHPGLQSAKIALSADTKTMRDNVVVSNALQDGSTPTFNGEASVFAMCARVASTRPQARTCALIVPLGTLLRRVAVRLQQLAPVHYQVGLLRPARHVLRKLVPRARTSSSQGVRHAWRARTASTQI